ncbi:MAG: M1 family metallopeptidase [Bacteroidetes bacterium]|nr:M1 family metallopeptidase [Bacteroidota bacterium]
MNLRYTLVLVLILTTTSLIAQQPIDILHYKFSIQLNDENDMLYGKAEIQLKYLNSSSEFALDLTGYNVQTRAGMIVDSVFNNKNKMELTAAASISKNKSNFAQQTSDKIQLTIASAQNTNSANDTNVITIYYHGIPSDGLIISKNKYGHRTFFADNWPNRAHNWIPCIDRPDDKASFEFIVTAPDHYQVVSNGVLIEETNLSNSKKLTHWKEDIPLPTKVMVIGVADFAVNYIGNIDNCIPISSWVFPENKEKGFYDYAIAKDILSFFINYIGPYPYKKLANVQSKTIFGGMENAGAIFYYENSVTGTRSSELLLVHEIVHQWFGDMASEKSFAHLWLSEGFATYLTHVYTEQKNGKSAFRNGLEADRQEVISFLKTSAKPVVDSITPTMQLLTPNSYARAGWVLNMLRNQIGDTAFHQLIQTYYETFKGSNADTKDFQKLAEKISGQSLETFFNQWLYTDQIPKLAITWKYDSRIKKTIISITQQQKTSPFIFPLEIQLLDKNKNSKKVILNISKTTEKFSIDAPFNPDTLITDPSVVLLFERTISSMK